MDKAANLTAESVSESSHCVRSIPSCYLFTAWFSVYLLLLPVFLFVLYIGFNKWKKPQSSASGGLSHSDVFTLNMVAMEIASIFGSCVSLYGFYTLNEQAITSGINTIVTTVTGQMLLHCLTCVERYLAVVHPVTYLRLRGEGGVTIRNISIALVWCFCVIYSLPMSILSEPYIYGLFGLVLSSASLPVVAYYSIYVLFTLIRPKPGERGGHRKQIDQSKRTTVYTMVAILGALLLRLMVFVVNACIMFWVWNKVDACALMIATYCSALPSSLVLPLLFLHRTRNK